MNYFYIFITFNYKMSKFLARHQEFKILVCDWSIHLSFIFFILCVPPISTQVHNKDGLISSMAVSIYLKLGRCVSSRHVGFFCLCKLTKMLSYMNFSGLKCGEILVQWRDACFIMQGESSKRLLIKAVLLKQIIIMNAHELKNRNIAKFYN